MVLKSKKTALKRKPLWEPSKERINGSNVSKFISKVNKTFGVNIRTFDDLWDWSVKNTRFFWETFANFSGLKSTPIQGPTHIRSQNMWEQHFFPEVSLNFAENLLQPNSTETAVVFWGEDSVRRSLTHSELFQEVTTIAETLKNLGLKPGDRVAGLVPNTPEALVAMLATAALGGVWASGSPDFGVEGALDRFGQIEPKFLFACDGYYYNGKKIDITEKVSDISKGLPSLKNVIMFNYVNEIQNIPADFKNWDDLVAGHDSKNTKKLAFQKFPFNHPLFIMFSSGTTGKPKCIVHGAGGTLLQHMKEHQLHMDVKPEDNMFYFTTCGWMMWNWLVTGLASKATIILFDGSPFARRGRILIDIIDEEKITLFGVSAKYIDALAKLKLHPKETHDLSSLRTIGSTGSPLSHESFEYIYKYFKQDVQLASLSGGTDIVSCFALGNPIGPVYKGQLQTRGLGLDVDVLDENGKSIINKKGELVCKQAFPCMPLYFWNDTNNHRYKESYFGKFSNIWCHGDYVELTSENGMVFHGRSDSVLNPGGVRIGTAEIYRQVEKVEEVLECFAVSQTIEKDERIVLFVKLISGIKLDDDLKQKIKDTILNNTTRRHVPEVIIDVPDIPKTRSGKIVELAVRNIIHGKPITNAQALQNPEALDFYKDLKELEI